MGGAINDDSNNNNNNNNNSCSIAGMTNSSIF
jgi:hypothetical protein